MATLTQTLKCLLPLAAVMIAGCGQELDYSGVIHSETDVNGRFSQSMDYNNSHAQRTVNVATETYVLAFGGDCHVGGTVNLTTLLDSAELPRVSALFLCGDNTTGLQEDYDRLKSLIDATDSVNLFMTTGNHDLYHAGWATYFPYFGPSVYTVEIKTPTATDLVIVVDNSSGTLGSEQMDWLSTTLTEKRALYRHCIVAGHVNFFRNRFTVSTNPLTEEIWALIDLFAQQRVDLLVTGHDHDRYIEVFGNTTYMTLDNVKDTEGGPSWMKLNVSPDSLRYEFISF